MVITLKKFNLTHSESFGFYGLNNLTILDLNNQSLKYLSNDSFNGLINLQNLTLNQNKLTNLYKDNFKGLNNLLDLQFTNNYLTCIRNETFIHLKLLISLSLDSNQIDTIDVNAFYKLNNLKHLNLNNNRIKQIINEIKSLIQIEQLQLENNELKEIQNFNIFQNLSILNLKSNNITKIDSNIFNGLLKLKLINLINNPINKIDTNGFNNSNFKEIRLSISNMSLEMLQILNNSLNPNLAYKSWIYEYYDSIYIENRVNIDCFKLFYLIKYKVYYNFINDNVDINDVITSDCLNLTQVRNNLNRFNDSFKHQNYIPKVLPIFDIQDEIAV